MEAQILSMRLFSECPESVVIHLSEIFSRAGVPHVVLPVWFDTYDFATRAEWLGIGAWGNRSVAPNLDGGELGEALVRVVASDESVKMFLQAQEIARKLGEGRVVACEKIIELLKL